MAFKTLDNQLADIPEDIIFCKNCVLSNQRPRTIINEQGICKACEWAYEKDHTVDWDSRRKELEELCDRHRSKDGSFDVVVPGSGGKDSGFVAHQLKYRYGMHPLCCTWAPFEWTDIGWRNLKAFIDAGYNNLIGQPDGILHRKLTRCAFECVGDAWQPFTYGQSSWAYHIAAQYNIKLTFMGENGELEYNGYDKYKNVPSQGIDALEDEHFKGAGVDKIVNYGIEKGIIKEEEVLPQTTQWYKPPPLDVVKKKNIEKHWFSYYEKWTPQENYYYAVKHTGFCPNDAGRTECTYTKYASLDDKADGFHYYLGYMKFGLGRATRDAMQDIRRNHITREEGVALVHRYDHEFPKKHFHWFLDYLNISEEFFWEVMDFYRSKSKVWQKKYGKWELKKTVS